MAVFSATTTSNKYISIELETRVEGQSVENNTTTLSWWLRVRKSSSSTSDTWGNCSYSANIGGHTYSGSSSVRVSPGGATELLSGAVTVGHNSDGTLTLSVSGSISGKIAGSVSGNQELATIPRASSLAYATPSGQFVIGSPITVCANSHSDRFTHSLTIQYGSYSTTILSYAAGNTNYGWTPSMEMCRQTPNATQGTGTLTLYTWVGRGESLVGTKSYSITLQVPSSVAPSISAVNVSEAVSGLAAQFGTYVQTKSKLRIKTSTSGSYGSSISNCQITVDGGTYSGTDVTSNPINSTGTVTITATVTDSRGRTASKSTSVSVTAYSPPAITALSVHRCKSDGTDDTSGDYLYISYAYAIAPVGNKNTHAATLYAKQSDGDDWIQIDQNPAYSASISIVPAGAFSSDYRFDVKLYVADYFGSTMMIVQVPSADTIIDILASGDAVAFGEVAEKPNTLTVAEDWTTRLRGGAEISGYPLADFVVEQGTDGIWTYRKYSSGIAECWGVSPRKQVAVTNAWGSVYASPNNTPICDQQDYPFAFTELPVVNATPVLEGYNYWLCTVGGTASTTKSPAFQAIRETGATVTGCVSLHALGRWK